MQTALALTALGMGLVGGPHCAAMCGAACGALVRLPSPQAPRRVLVFQAGRLLGYAAAGGVAASAVQSLAWLSGQAGAFRPVWTLVQVGMLAWGGALLVTARQPAWVNDAGRQLWARWRPLAARRPWLLAAGMLWALMPCGLLYSALLVAALAGGPLQGALAMALFALGSAVSLVGGPWLWLRLQSASQGRYQALGMRAAGASLCAVAAWTLWHGADARLQAFCF